MDNKNDLNETFSQENVNGTNADALKNEAHKLFEQFDTDLAGSREMTEQALKALEEIIKEQEEYYKALDEEYQRREEEISRKEEQLKGSDEKNAMFDQMSALTNDPAMQENIDRLREIEKQEKEKIEREKEADSQRIKDLIDEKNALQQKLENAKKQVSAFKEQVSEKYRKGIDDTIAQTKAFTKKCLGRVDNLEQVINTQNGEIKDLKETAVLQSETIAAMKVVSAEQAMDTLAKSDAFTQLGVKPIKLNVTYNGSIYGVKEGGNYETGRMINKEGIGEDCRMLEVLERNDVFIDSRVNRQGDIHKAYVPINDDRGTLKGYAEIDMNGRTLLNDDEKKALIDAVNSDHGTAVKDIVSTVEYNLGNEGLDDLTELGKNKYGRTWLQTEGFELLKQGKPISIVLVDGDTFKSFNTKYGYNGGDTVLKHIADSMKTAALESREKPSDEKNASGDRRRTDKHEDPFPYLEEDLCLFRKGGDEFVMLVPCDGPAAYAIAKRAQGLVSDKELEGNFVMDGHIDGKDVKMGDPAKFHATISVGVVEVRLSEEECKALTRDNVVEVVNRFMSAANERLDRAKMDGVTGVDADGRNIKRAGIAKADPETERKVNMRTFEKNYNELFNKELPDDIRHIAENSMAEESDKENVFKAVADKEGNISYYADIGYECIMLKSKAESGEYRLDIGGDMMRVDHDTFLKDYHPATKEQLAVSVVDMSEKAYNNQQPKAFERDGEELNKKAEEDEKRPNNSLPLTADDFHL